MKRMVLFLLIAVFTVLQAFALTEEEFERAVEEGYAAKNQKEAPLWINLGNESPKGSFLRSTFIGTSEAPYTYLAQGCYGTVKQMAFSEKLHYDDGLAKVRAECIGKSPLWIAVVGQHDANQAASDIAGYYALPTRAVTAIFLEIDGERVRSSKQERFSHLGDGNGLMSFDSFAVLESATSIKVVAVIGGEYLLKESISSSELESIHWHTDGVGQGPLPEEDDDGFGPPKQSVF